MVCRPVFPKLCVAASSLPCYVCRENVLRKWIRVIELVMHRCTKYILGMFLEHFILPTVLLFPHWLSKLQYLHYIASHVTHLRWLCNSWSTRVVRVIFPLKDVRYLANESASRWSSFVNEVHDIHVNKVKVDVYGTVSEWGMKYFQYSNLTLQRIV